MWSNFWGAIDQAGYYARSEDYLNIINYNRLWVYHRFVSFMYALTGMNEKMQTLEAKMLLEYLFYKCAIADAEQKLARLPSAETLV